MCAEPRLDLACRARLLGQFRLGWIMDELAPHLPLELDFQREAANLERCGRFFSAVPKSYDDNKLSVMEALDLLRAMGREHATLEQVEAWKFVNYRVNRDPMTVRYRTNGLRTEVTYS